MQIEKLTHRPYAMLCIICVFLCILDVSEFSDVLVKQYVADADVTMYPPAFVQGI